MKKLTIQFTNPFFFTFYNFSFDDAGRFFVFKKSGNGEHFK